MEDHDKTTFNCPWGTYAYNVFPFGLCNAPATFQREFFVIFAYLIHECVEVYIDDFTVYGCWHYATCIVLDGNSLR